jgi:hypothetical protein
MVRTLIAATLLVAVLCADLRASAAQPCKLQSVDKPEKAQLKVYFTKFTQEDNTSGKYKACRIVAKADKDTITFYITPFRQDATVVVHKSNWPG